MAGRPPLPHHHCILSFTKNNLLIFGNKTCGLPDKTKVACGATRDGAEQVLILHLQTAIIRVIKMPLKFQRHFFIYCGGGGGPFSPPGGGPIGGPSPLGGGPYGWCRLSPPIRLGGGGPCGLCGAIICITFFIIPSNFFFCSSLHKALTC